VRTALLWLALAASACTSGSRSEPEARPPAATTVAATPTAPTELTRTERVTLRVIGMT
jgi:hypothetical protein